MVSPLLTLNRGLFLGPGDPGLLAGGSGGALIDIDFTQDISSFAELTGILLPVDSSSNYNSLNWGGPNIGAAFYSALDDFTGYGFAAVEVEEDATYTIEIESKYVVNSDARVRINAIWDHHDLSPGKTHWGAVNGSYPAIEQNYAKTAIFIGNAPYNPPEYPFEKRTYSYTATGSPYKPKSVTFSLGQSGGKGNWYVKSFKVTKD